MVEEINHDRRRFLGHRGNDDCLRRARHDRFCGRTIQQGQAADCTHD